MSLSPSTNPKETPVSTARINNLKSNIVPGTFTNTFPKKYLNQLVNT